MKKRFNITGICRAELHYMMDNSQKLKEVIQLVEYGEYFTIHRPRQFGKTTMLQYMDHTLQQSSDYLPIRMSFQGVDEHWHTSDEAFATMFFNLLTKFLTFYRKDLSDFFASLKPQIVDMDSLSEVITKIAHKINKKLVLLIDEVDASSNYLPFLSFLAMLRTKYLDRFSPFHATFHSIVLAGVHDIKSLKYKKKHHEKAEFNSPWNIAADFKVRMSFIPSEIEPMLVDYSQAEGAKMNIPAIAQRLYYHTSGYPFLVSKLCKIIAEDILPKRTSQNWTLEDVEVAVQMLLNENNTNFDSLIKNLENHTNLYHLVHRLLLDGDTIPFNPHNPDIHKGILYGVFKNNGQLKIHNRLYEQLIYNYLTSKKTTRLRSSANYGGHFLLDNNALEMKAVLLKFQQFMKEQYSEKSKNFVEHEGRILFLAFLAPILNGQGHAFREVQTSMEKRLDVVVTYFQHRYIIELKRWYGDKAHQKGLDQLADYLDIHQVTEGFLVIFDDRKQKAWATETITHKGKEIFAVWV